MSSVSFLLAPPRSTLAPSPSKGERLDLGSAAFTCSLRTAHILMAPDITNYTMVNRTYRYWDQDPPAYPFGYGLSYSTFSYSDLSVTPQKIHPEESVTIEARITNTGSIDGDEVVQVYISWVDATEPMPKLQLVHFDRILIPSGSTQVIHHIISPEQMSVYEDDHGLIVRPGVINVYIGGQQPDQETSASSNVLNGEFTIIS